MKEWSLMIFTLLVQLGIGAFIFAAIINFNSPGSGLEKNLKIPFTIISGVLVLATLISFFHLGSPLNAIKSLNNIGTSWLSKEILLNSLFLGLVLVVTISFYTRLIPDSIGKGALITGCITGITLIFAMARLYMLPVVPVWNNFTTPISFYLSAVILGASFCLIVSVTMSESLSKWFSPLLIVIILGLILQIIIFGILSTLLSNDSPASAQSLSILVKNSLPLLILRITTIFIPLLIFLLALFNLNFRSVLFKNPTVLYLCTGSIFLSEIFGRCLFFLSFVKTGI